ncbi:uncharacterized protein LOC121739617 [Aricia agestis]|uniref:uncharacterized protein LOC121739617 n=1 Tax=Aricia agestis TaxID=91739 RepID=UPI001C2071AE|nr:uncharacterized protein LOC121739617 [Aricia agestis]
MFNINTELTAECIKSLADNNRCITCDKLNTPCARYPCGHAVCAECVSVAECCLLCITPPPKITHYEDEPLSRRVEHASQLVSAYQELFGEDVDKRVSILKQQKLEKLIFPECIQASNKYFNKRKSSTSFSKGKENIKPPIPLPGEEVPSRSLKMENKNTYVQQWLNNIQSPATSKIQRKPFADLNVNSNIIQNTSTKERQTRTYGKRKHFKTMSNHSENVPVKKSKSNSSFIKGMKHMERFNKSHQRKHEADESGIVMDDDVIEILDSQEVADKDKLACRAIEDAELNKDDICMDLFNDSSYVEQTLPKVCVTSNKTTKTYKVPFYKKSFLHQTCEGHRSCCIDEQKKTNFKNISITIENKSFVTMINVSNCEEHFENAGDKNSKHIVLNEAPISDKNNKNITKEPVQLEDIPHIKDCHEEIKAKIESNTKNDNLKKGVIVSDSDSDSVLSFIDKEKEVVVEIHRSCNETDYTVLSELDLNQSENRVRHAHRENTPLSTDSSDKENYDPNRMKRMKHDKKCYQKK